MAILVSLNPKVKQVFCLVRRQWVAATPEELVRQRLLLKLTNQLGFPLGHVAVEVSLRQMPHLATLDSSTLPHRRADILCYARNLVPGESLGPLLLIECKAVPLNARVLRQTIGYNRYVQARYIAVVNQSEERLGWFDAGSGVYQFNDNLSSFAALSQ